MRTSACSLPTARSVTTARLAPLVSDPRPGGCGSLTAGATPMDWPVSPAPAMHDVLDRLAARRVGEPAAPASAAGWPMRDRADRVEVVGDAERRRAPPRPGPAGCRRSRRRGPRRPRSAGSAGWPCRCRCPRRASASAPRRGRSSPCRARRSGRGRPPCSSTGGSRPAPCIMPVSQRSGCVDVVGRSRAQKRRTSSGWSSTRNAQPWLNPALGARVALRSARSTTAGSTGRRRRSCGPSGGGVRRPGTPWWSELCLTTSSGCGPTSPRSGGPRRPAATSASRSRPPSASCRVVRRAVRGPRAARSRPTRSATSSAGGTRGAGPGGADRLAPGLGARRRGVRRPAGRGLGAGGGRRAARRGGSCRRRPVGVGGVRRGGGVAVRAGLPGLAAGDRRRLVGAGPRAAGPGRRRARRRRPRAAAPGAAGRRRARSSSCTSSRAATWSTAAPRSGWRARSGRTGATGSTSPARPTTPARPGWRTARDPMLTYAMTALAANKQARLAGQRATFGRVEVDAQRHQRRAVAGDRLAGRPGVVRRRRWPTLVDGGLAAGRRAGRAGRHLAGGHRRVGVGRGRLRPGAGRRGSPPTTRAATGRSSRPRPATTPASCPRPGSRPRCCSSATRPGSRHSPGRARRDRRLPGRRRTPWPTPSSGWRGDAVDGVPPRAGLGRRRRPRRRAGRDRGRAVHPGRATELTLGR